VQRLVLAQRQAHDVDVVFLDGAHHRRAPAAADVSGVSALFCCSGGRSKWSGVLTMRIRSALFGWAFVTLSGGCPNV
jgi:hypothetical protein